MVDRRGERSVIMVEYSMDMQIVYDMFLIHHDSMVMLVGLIVLLIL
jgi:hypothetical protein